MKKQVLQHRIPTIFGLFLVILGIGVTSYLVQTGVITVGRAAPETTPANVIISNATDKSFAVAFTTVGKSVAGITVEAPGKAPATFFDQRNKDGSNESYFSHRIIAENLAPDTLYKFSIISNGETYLKDGLEYEVKTGPKINTTSTSGGRVSGSALLPDGTPASDTVVELIIPNAQRLSALTDSSGNYLFSLSELRSASLVRYATPSPTSIITIRLFRQDMTSEIKSTLASAQELPPATLSSQYDFSKTTETPQATGSSLLTQQTQTTPLGQISITNPSPNETFVDSRPQFTGTALPQKPVRITIDRQTPATVNSDARGLWSYRPASAIPSGSHTLSAQSPDSIGISKSVSVPFTVFASGTQIAQSATPSATTAPTSTPTPTRTPTPTPTRTPTPTQTQSLAPSPSISPTPTTSAPTSSIPSPTPTTITLMTPTPTLIAAAPTTGQTNPTQTPQITPAPTGTLSTILIGFASLVLITAGTALLFLL